ncbi:MAG: hypothetical protein R3F49_02305 [Planctomycetota bacterium]
MPPISVSLLIASSSVVPWLLLLAALVAGVVGVGVRVVLLLGRLDLRLSRLEDAAHRLGRQDGPGGPGGPGSSGGAAPRPFDLSRIEGLLGDLRDVQRRLDDRLSALAERATAPPQAAAVAGAPPSALSGPALLIERALNRLLALGYEQVEVVTPRDAIEPDGAIIVEARRFGAIHKGEVRLSGGVVVDVVLRPSHELFP